MNLQAVSWYITCYNCSIFDPWKAIFLFKLHVLCFLLICDKFILSYLLKISGDFIQVLWKQLTYHELEKKWSNSKNCRGGSYLVRLCLLLLLARILDILILQDKTLFCALEAADIVCWLVNQPIAKLDLFKSFDCRWICKTYAEYCYWNSATVCRLVLSPTLQSTIFCGVHSGFRGKGIRV